MATRTPKPKAAPSEDDAVETLDEDTAQNEAGLEAQLKLKELVETVVDRTGQRKGEVRTAIQAALAVLGDALAEGKDVNLPPLGKLKVTRAKETPRGQAMVVKLVQNRRAPDAEADGDAETKEGLAEPVQDV